MKNMKVFALICTSVFALMIAGCSRDHGSPQSQYSQDSDQSAVTSNSTTTDSTIAQSMSADTLSATNKRADSRSLARATRQHSRAKKAQLEEQYSNGDDRYLDSDEYAYGYGDENLNEERTPAEAVGDVADYDREKMFCPDEASAHPAFLRSDLAYSVRGVDCFGNEPTQRTAEFSIKNQGRRIASSDDTACDNHRSYDRPLTLRADLAYHLTGRDCQGDAPNHAFGWLGTKRNQE